MFSDGPLPKEAWAVGEPLERSLDFSDDEFAQELQQFAERLSLKIEKEHK